MNTKNILTIMIAAFALCGCTRVIICDKTAIDLRPMSIKPGVAFDIRILKDIHGNPSIIDTGNSSLAYMTDYHKIEYFLFMNDKPEGTERWYLVLRPADADKFYYGEKYYIYYPSQSSSPDGKGDRRFAEPKPYKTVDEIMKYCKKRPESLGE